MPDFKERYIHQARLGTIEEPSRDILSVQFPLGSTPEISLSNGALTLQSYRNTSLSNNPASITTSPGSVMGWTLYNFNASPVYIKVYNALVGDVSVGTTPVWRTIFIPPGDGSTPGMHFQETGTTAQVVCPVAITIAAVTGLLDGSSSAPVSPVYVEMPWV